MAESDAALITASVAEPERFAELFDRHYDRIAGYLRRRLLTPLADDLAADTFLKAFELRGRYDASRPDASPWLFGIATNLLRRHRRDQARGLRAYAAEARATADRGGDAGEVDARLDAQAAAPAVADAIQGLEARDRDALLLLAWGELSYGEIAEALAVPVGTVRSRINRARRQIGRDLESAASNSGGSPLVLTRGPKEAS